MDLHALREQLARWLIARAISDPEDLARRARDGLVPVDQQANHVLRRRYTSLFLDRRELQELPIRPGSREAERTDALRDDVHGQCQLAVLRLEHEVQSAEHGTRDVPVEVVR